jgi:hypothetical protein
MQIPSIPGNQEKYGYTEDPSTFIILDYKLVINEPQMEKHTGLKQDTIGPGHY